MCIWLFCVLVVAAAAAIAVDFIAETMMEKILLWKLYFFIISWCRGNIYRYSYAFIDFNRQVCAFLLLKNEILIIGGYLFSFREI